MAWREKLKYIYPMLGIVEAFFIFPIMYSYLKISTHVPGSPRSILWNIIFAHTVYLQCAVCDRRNMDRGCSLESRKICISIFEISKVLEKSVSFRLPETEKNKIMRELGMKGNVELYQNYAVTSPIVIGWRQKKSFSGAGV